MSRVCIVIPLFNEELRFKANDLLKFISQSTVDFILVDDGSSDNIYNLLISLELNSPDRIKSIKFDKNSGKAEAIRRGILVGANWKKFEFIGFCDADFSAPLSEIVLLHNALLQSNYLVAIGSRVKKLGSNIVRKRSRHLLGRIFMTASNFILKIPVYDSQCGLKLFHASLISLLFDEKFITKWLFDLEIIAKLRNHFGKNVRNIITEVPLNNWTEVSGSKLKLIHLISVPFQLYLLCKKYNIKHTKTKNIK